MARGRLRCLKHEGEPPRFVPRERANGKVAASSNGRAKAAPRTGRAKAPARAARSKKS
jgi:hypothetical protein